MAQVIRLPITKLSESPTKRDLGSVMNDMIQALYTVMGTGRSIALSMGLALFYQKLRMKRSRSFWAMWFKSGPRVARLFFEDWKDLSDGIYPWQAMVPRPWSEYVKPTFRALVDLPLVVRRMRQRKTIHWARKAFPERYPKYYQRNFHYQSGGYLSHQSAEIYDVLVEFLFSGTAEVMRRRMLRPIVEYAVAQGYPEGYAQNHTVKRPLRILDVGCGTGHLLRLLGATLPEAQLYGVDLSPFYVARARRLLPADVHVNLAAENAEALTFKDNTFDIVTSLYVLHELPEDVRLRVLREMRRVVRFGGLIVMGDVLQLRDAKGMTPELHEFPRIFHEPYFKNYITGSMTAWLRHCGLNVVYEYAAHWTKIVAARKPAL